MRVPVPNAATTERRGSTHSDGQPIIALMPKYLYLNDPGSRWQLADDVDIDELRKQLGETRFGDLQTEVMVDGVREPLTIRHDQVYTHAVVDTPAMRPTRRSCPLPRAGRAIPLPAGLAG